MRPLHYRELVNSTVFLVRYNEEGMVHNYHLELQRTHHKVALLTEFPFVYDQFSYTYLLPLSSDYAARWAVTDHDL